MQPLAADARERRRPLRWRAVLLVAHRWFGLLAAVWLLPLAATGCAITFYDELDTWLNPELRRVPECTLQPATAMPVERAIGRARLTYPGFEARHIDVPVVKASDAGPCGRCRDGGLCRSAGRPCPRRARLNGQVAFDRRQVMDLLYGLHMDLLLGPPEGTGESSRSSTARAATAYRMRNVTF